MAQKVKHFYDFFWPTSWQFWNRSLGIGFRNNLWAIYQWLLISYLFSGVGAILANSRCTSPAPRRRTTPKPQEPEVNIPGPDNTEMLIMGILRDKKEEKYHEAHNVSNLYHPIHTYVHDFWKIEFETLSSNQGGRTWFLLPV